MDETITEQDLDDLFWIFSTGSKAVRGIFKKFLSVMFAVFPSV